jgi:hypothetical protein
VCSSVVDRIPHEAGLLASFYKFPDYDCDPRRLEQKWSSDWIVTNLTTLCENGSVSALIFLLNFFSHDFALLARGLAMDVGYCTVRVTAHVATLVPEVPVTVTV